MILKKHLVFWPCWVVAWLMVGDGVLGQETPDPVVESLETKISHFLEAVSMGDTQTAYQELLVGSPLLKQTKALKDLIDRTNELKSLCGRYRAFERVAGRRVGKDLVLLRYLYKGETLPVVWYFTFYRPPPATETTTKVTDNWRVIDVRFDTNLWKLAEEGGK